MRDLSIDLTSSEVFEVGAAFVTLLAFPQEQEAAAREAARVSLCATAVRGWARKD